MSPAPRLFGLLTLVAGLALQAQQFGPVEIIPITKVREHYNIPAENGNGKSCGVYLFGEFPVFKNYTNHNSYVLLTPGLQSNPHGGFGSIAPAPGGTHRFYCYFNGVSTPFNDSPCPDTIGEQHPDWHAEIRPRGPQASFTAKADPTRAGQWGFQSTSTEPEGDALTERWEFGDGGTASSTGVNHRYTTPGSFTAYLTVTDTDGLTNRTSRTIQVAAPKPLVSVRLFNKHSGNRIELEEEFGVRVTVRASDDGLGALSDLAFTGPALSIPDIFSIVNAPTETPIGTLQPGDQREFNWTLRADRAGEFALIAPSVTGKDAIGRTVSGAGAAAQGEVTSLIVGITQHPPRFVLGGDNNDDGETNALDRLVALIVGITNVSKQDITGVKAVIPADPIQITSLAQDLNIWLTPITVPLGDFGTILPGPANAVRSTNLYEATDRTYAEASILLQGKVGEAGVQARGEGLVNIGGETLIEARFDVEDRPYLSGQTVRLFGSLKNVSRFLDNKGGVIDEGKTIGVVIYPTIEGNGAGGYCFLRDSGGRTPEGPTAFLLAPDETIEIAAIIPTAEATNQTTLRVNYQVHGYIHGDRPKPQRAKPTDIEIVEKASEGWSAQHEIELAGVPAVTDAWLVCPTALSFAGFVSCRFTEGLGNLGGGLADLAMLTGAGLQEIVVGHHRLAAWKLWMLGQALEGLNDPAARARLAEEIIIDLQALKAVGVESLEGVELAAESIGPAVERAIMETGRTLESGDLKQIAGGMARITGENIDMPLEALVAARSIRKALLIREGAQSAAKQALEESFERQARELGGTVDDYAARGALAKLPESDDLPTGVNVVNEPRVYRGAYGARKEDVDGVLAVAREEGVVLTFRSRSPKAAELLDAIPPTHLLKAGGISIKTVSELDIKYLGYPSRFEAECALVEPPIPWIDPKNPAFDDVANDFLNRFPELKLGDDASVALRAEVYERLKFQMEQWPEQAQNFIKYSREGIDVDFHAQKQGVGLGRFLLPNAGSKRPARLEPHSFIDPYSGQRRNAYRLLMDDGTGVFKPITGDIDFLSILNPDGTMPSLLKRLRVYRKMVALGMQHGESFTFFKRALREKFLRCCTPKVSGGDGEKMLAATPYGELLTTQFVDGLSVVEGGPNAALRIGLGEFSFLKGTLTEVHTLERTASEALPNALRRDIAPLVTVSALARMVGELEAEADRTGGVKARMGPDGQPELYDPAPPSVPSPLMAPVRSPRGPIGRLDDTVEDALEAELDKLAAAGWVNVRGVPPPGAAGGQWRPATPEEARGGPVGSALKLAPYTYLTEDVPAGTAILPVLPAVELGLAAKEPIFAVGDQVVIDPGGSREEFATLVSVHPFTLNRPLQYLQEIGTTVLFLSGLPEPATLPGALPARDNLLVWLRADAGVELDGTNVVSWTDQSRNGFQFRTPTGSTKPAWVSDVVNGLPSVQFTGDRLTANLGLTLSNATIFTLCRFTSVSGSTYVYAFGTRNFSGLQMTLARRSGDGAYHFDGAAERNADNTIPGADYRIFSQVFGGNAPDHHQLSANLRTLLDTRTTTGRAYSAVATNVFLGSYTGGGLFFTGDLTEWLVYDRALTGAERLQVEEYLRQRAGLPPLFVPGSLALDQWQALGYDHGAAPAAAWTLDQANRTVVQPVASDPSLLLSPFAAAEHQIIRARLSARDATGFMGFVFGYLNPGHYYLLDWQQAASTHPEFGAAPRGLRLRAIHIPDGTAPTGTDLWSSPDPARATTLRTHDIPWVAGREYELVLSLRPGSIEVSVLDGAAELVAWTVEGDLDASGQFGYYVNALAGGRFGQVRSPGMAPLVTGVRPGEDGSVTLDWIGGVEPYLIEAATDLGLGDWIDAAPATPNQSESLVLPPGNSFFRVRSAGVTP